jgi:hypothetical protein
MEPCAAHFHSCMKTEKNWYAKWSTNYKRLRKGTQQLMTPIRASAIMNPNIQLLQGIYIYQVIHKSVKHFKNLQQLDHATDHGNSYADRERNSPSFFFFYIFHSSSMCPPAAQSQWTRLLRIPKHKMTAHVYWMPYLLLLSSSGKSGQLCVQAFP